MTYLDEHKFKLYEKKMALAEQNYQLMKKCAVETGYFQQCPWYKKLLWIIIK